MEIIRISSMKTTGVVVEGLMMKMVEKESRVAARCFKSERARMFSTFSTGIL